VQLAALLTDVDLLVLTGGGDPSPYLMDRVRGTRDDISVVVAAEDTVDTMRAIEGLYGASRFDGAGKMLRAAQLLDQAGCPVTFA
jgi:BioD-like phosphotransacetylase family protein